MPLQSHEDYSGSITCVALPLSVWLGYTTHLLLQTRVKTLNRELGTVFKRWYPDLDVEELPDAA